MERTKEIETRKAEIAKLCKEAKGEELNKLYEEMQALTNEANEIRKAADEAEKRKKIAEQLNDGKLKSKKIDDKKDDKLTNKIDSTEYRKAFMDYVLTGEMPVEFRDVSLTANNGAVIPTAVMNTVVEKMDSYGTILPLVRKLIRQVLLYRLRLLLLRQHGYKKAQPLIQPLNLLLV